MSPPLQFFQFRIVEGREILSLRHSLRDTNNGAQFDQYKMIWKICEFSFVIVQQISLHSLIGLKWFVRGHQFCRKNRSFWIVLSNKFPCRFWTIRYSASQLVAHVRYCSVDTKLNDWYDRAKNHLNGIVVATEV